MDILFTEIQEPLHVLSKTSLLQLAFMSLDA